MIIENKDIKNVNSIHIWENQQLNYINLSLKNGTFIKLYAKDMTKNNINYFKSVIRNEKIYNILNKIKQENNI